MLEKMIIDYCAPTLANMKSANMFNYKYESLLKLQEEIAEANKKLNEKGVFVEVLKVAKTRALVYVYREYLLEADLAKEGVESLLRQYGYSNLEVSECLETLKQHLRESDCFPHEIGVFLGYPLADVQGFIKHGGKNCKYCGIWKVYSNECETRQLFAKFRKCTEIYMKVFTAGRPIAQMTVAA